MKYKVLRIEEDLDFGCEERPEGQKVLAVVTLQDENGKSKVIKAEDDQLYRDGICEGDIVELEQENRITKKQWLPH
ncbi:MAG: hypothetical protein ACI4EG_02755 [Fusicatenibacter sp.]|nr:hypothetical protein [Fusicatenibacter sp.]